MLPSWSIVTTQSNAALRIALLRASASRTACSARRRSTNCPICEPRLVIVASRSLVGVAQIGREELDHREHGGAAHRERERRLQPRAGGRPRARVAAAGRHAGEPGRRLGGPDAARAGPRRRPSASARLSATKSPAVRPRLDAAQRPALGRRPHGADVPGQRPARSPRAAPDRRRARRGPTPARARPHAPCGAAPRASEPVRIAPYDKGVGQSCDHATSPSSRSSPSPRSRCSRDGICAGSRRPTAAALTELARRGTKLTRPSGPSCARSSPSSSRARSRSARRTTSRRSRCRAGWSARSR